MYKKILVGIDDSQDAMDAVKKALEFKKSENSEVIVFHSVIHHISELIPNLSFTATSTTSVSFSVHEDYINLGRKILKTVKKLFADDNQQVETRLIFDISPENYIIKKVEEENFDLVILGCKGKHSKIKRTFLGTIPNRVINNAACDVLIVR
ncbi:MAG: universal stress protein [Promethearchaeota archaeon]